MGRRFLMKQPINLIQLISEIDEYILLTNCFDPYIFMSEDTMKAIDEASPPSMKSHRGNKNGKYSTFIGYKLFINNDLRFGIVEIR